MNKNYSIFIDGYHFFKHFWEKCYDDGYSIDMGEMFILLEELIREEKSFNIDVKDKLICKNKVMYMASSYKAENAEVVEEFLIEMGRFGIPCIHIPLKNELGIIKEDGCDTALASGVISSADEGEVVILITGDQDHSNTFTVLKQNNKAIPLWCYIKNKTTNLKKLNVKSFDLNQLYRNKEDYSDIFLHNQENNEIILNNMKTSKGPANSPDVSETVDQISAIKNCIKSLKKPESDYVLTNMVGIEVRKQYGDILHKTKLVKFLLNNPEEFEVIQDEDNEKVFFVKVPYDNKDYVKAVWDCIDKCRKNQDGNILVNEIGIQLAEAHGKKFLPKGLLKFLRDNPDDFNVIESDSEKDVFYVSRDRSKNRDTKYVEAVTSCINKCNPVKGRYVLVNEVGIKLSDMYGKDYLPSALGKFLRNHSEKFTIGYHTETNALIVKLVKTK